MKYIQTSAQLPGGGKVHPVSRVFGFDRGKPIDRHYIEQFLEQNRKNIRGDVLEIADNQYTRMFQSDRIESSAVLHVAPENSGKDQVICGNLETGAAIPRDAFDCVILTQTLNVVYDVRSAIRTLHGSLRSGGIVLCTVPGISQISRYDMNRWGDYWRFTTLSIKKMFSESFMQKNIHVESYGNVYASSSFLYGIPVQDLTDEQRDYHDDDYEMLIGVRAFKE